LASPTEQTAASNTMPRPELNPLLNPLLAQNMGRWAETYYTAPPEKREEAVLELLRELQSQNPAGESTTNSIPFPAPASEDHAPHFELQPDAELLPNKFSPHAVDEETQMISLHCPHCGHDNPPGHSFCGECGEKLGHSGSAAAGADFLFAPPADGEVIEPHGDSIHASLERRPEEKWPEPGWPEPASSEHGSFEHGSFEQGSSEQLREPGYEPPPHEQDFAATALFAPRWHAEESPHTENFLHSEDLDEPDLNLYPPEGPRSYRVFIAAAVIIVFLVLAYMAWRGTKAAGPSHVPQFNSTTSDQTGSSAGAGAPAGIPETNPAPPASQPQANQENGATAHSANSANSSTPKVEPPANRQDALQKASSTAAAPRSVAPLEGKDTQSSHVPIAGGEELSTAQKYLNGQPRDAAQAAPWLWKAVGKQNGEATVLLADLYLKGDGVAKNCDQARLLLDAAASKGVPGAGERLRNMQAFGCQ
jgi:hypothetical protein